MADCSARLDGCGFFSKIDLQKGYLQVPVAAADVQKTAVITPFGLFEFLRMPVGLRNAGMTFQRMIYNIFADLPYLFIYLYDTLVNSHTTAEHQRHLCQVLHLLRINGLLLNREKYSWGVSSLEFLGHVVSATGVAPLPSRIAAIRAHPKPATIQQLQGFLGLFNFYRRFIPAAAAVIKPLTDAFKGGKSGKTGWSGPRSYQPPSWQPRTPSLSCATWSIQQHPRSYQSPPSPLQHTPAAYFSSGSQEAIGGPSVSTRRSWTTRSSGTAPSTGSYWR
jgi:Reverse transcriptase (RNA-dependent DNA polymerase)